MPTAGFTASPDKRYQFLKQLGSGSYGFVAAVRDLEQGIDVAMKKIPELGDFTVCRRTLREIKLMRHFRHRNLLHIEDALALTQDSQAVYVVTPLMDCDLNTLLHKRSTKLTSSHVRGFLSQMLLGLLHLHSGHVIHRDLKPANIFVRKDGLLKIGDLGLSRGIDLEDESLEPLRQPDEQLTEYVVTRWWRAPEVFLTPSQYGPPVDVWSIGCILSEMVTGTALFPGKNSFDQLKRNIAILGTPKGDHARALQQGPGWKMIRQLPTCEPKLEKLQENWRISPSAELSDLMEQMLSFNPDERISLEQSLVHPALERLCSSSSVAEAKLIAVFNQDYDKEYDGLSRSAQKVALKEVVNRLVMEVENFRESAAPITPRVSRPDRLQRATTTPSPRVTPRASRTAGATTKAALEEEGVYENTPDLILHQKDYSRDTSQLVGGSDSGKQEKSHASRTTYESQGRRQSSGSSANPKQDDPKPDRCRAADNHEEDNTRERRATSSQQNHQGQVRFGLAAESSRSTSSTEAPNWRRPGRDASAPAVGRVSATARSSQSSAAGTASRGGAFKPPSRLAEGSSRASLGRALPGDLPTRPSQNSQREPSRKTSATQGNGLWLLEEEIKDLGKPRLASSQRTVSEANLKGRRSSDGDIRPRVGTRRSSDGDVKPGVSGTMLRRRWGSVNAH